MRDVLIHLLRRRWRLHGHHVVIDSLHCNEVAVQFLCEISEKLKYII